MNNKPTGRMLWEKFVELESHYPRPDLLAVNIGADDPMDLDGPEALEFAGKIAKKRKCKTFLEAEDDIRLYGQNHLAERTFFFKNSQPFISGSDDDRLELSIRVMTPEGCDLLENESFLKQMVKTAMKKGFPRFVGVLEASEHRPEWDFLFSRADYFDADDMLVSNPVVKEKIRKIAMSIKS